MIDSTSSRMAMKAGSDQLKRVYEYFRKLEWETWEPEDIAPHKPFILTIWEFRRVRGGDNKSLLTMLKRIMPALELHFGEGQTSGKPAPTSSQDQEHGPMPTSGKCAFQWDEQNRGLRPAGPGA